jgi:hypothetical protein
MTVGMVRYGSAAAVGYEQPTVSGVGLSVDDEMMQMIPQLVFVMNLLHMLVNFKWTYMQNKQFRVRWTEL